MPVLQISVLLELIPIILIMGPSIFNIQCFHYEIVNFEETSMDEEL